MQILLQESGRIREMPWANTFYEVWYKVSIGLLGKYSCISEWMVSRNPAEIQTLLPALDSEKTKYIVYYPKNSIGKFDDCISRLVLEPDILHFANNFTTR